MGAIVGLRLWLLLLLLGDLLVRLLRLLRVLGVALGVIYGVEGLAIRGLTHLWVSRLLLHGLNLLIMHLDHVHFVGVMGVVAVDGSLIGSHATSAFGPSNTRDEAEEQEE